jgi:hypothetical protein
MLDFHSNSNAHMERDSISFRKYLSAATVHFQPREKPLTTQNLSHQNLPRFPCHSPYSFTDLLKQHLGKSAHNKLLYLDVRTTNCQKAHKTASKIVLPLASISVPMFAAVWHVQQINQQHSKTENSSLGFAPKFSWEMCQLLDSLFCKGPKYMLISDMQALKSTLLKVAMS